jgi:signal transduction histidine kinase
LRGALARVALAITSMVALAFLVPLSLLLKEIVHERAVADARLQASAMVAVLAVTADRASLAQAAASTEAGAAGRLAVYPPGAEPIGTRHADEPTVRAVESSRTTAVRDVPGGLSYLQPVAVQGGRIAVVEVFVPDATLTYGVHPAWLALAGVAVTLVAGSVAVADRLGARMVRSTRGLARAARRIGHDDLAVRVVPGGPPEIAEVGRAFNAMADRMVGLLRSERELAANLSHRLRTPLTALRLELETTDNWVDLERLRQAVTILSDEVDGIIRATREPLSARPAEHCDLTDVLADRLAFWSVLAEDHGRPWTVIGGAEPLWVAVRRSDAEAAIDALVGNVFHHTPEGTPFRAGVVGSALVVEDDGPGIANPEDALRRGASFGGSTGLGLDIAQRFATDSGGDLVIGRSASGGTRVEINLGRPES